MTISEIVNENGELKTRFNAESYENDIATYSRYIKLLSENKLIICAFGNLHIS